MLRFPIVPAKPAFTVEFLVEVPSKIGLLPAPGTPPCQFATVVQLSSPPKPIHVKSATPKFHPVLLPEFTLLVPTALMRVPLMLYESCTSR